MIKGWDVKQLKEFCADRSIKWQFTTTLAPHQNGCTEAMIKSVKAALKKAIGDTFLASFELYTCLLEIANLVNQRPIGRIPTDPDDGSYFCPNDILLGRATSAIPQGPSRQTNNPRHRFEFCQRVVEAVWRKWSRDVLPHLQSPTIYYPLSMLETRHIYAFYPRNAQFFSTLSKGGWGIGF